MNTEMIRMISSYDAGFGGSYNRHSAKLILTEVTREHGKKAADELIVELALNRVFDFVVGGDLDGS